MDYGQVVSCHLLHLSLMASLGTSSFPQGLPEVIHPLQYHPYRAHRLSTHYSSIHIEHMHRGSTVIQTVINQRNVITFIIFLGWLLLQRSLGEYVLVVCTPQHCSHLSAPHVYKSTCMDPHYTTWACNFGRFIRNPWTPFHVCGRFPRDATSAIYHTGQSLIVLDLTKPP